MRADEDLAYRDAFSDHRQVPSIPIVLGDRSTEPLVTIAIPTFRRPQLLKEAIASVLSQRTSVPFEVVVVDNDPDEIAGQQTQSLIEEFRSERLHYFRNRDNIGMFGNWNRCLTLGRGEWISILNDDDWLEPGYLEQTISEISRRPGIDLLAVGFNIKDMRRQGAQSPWYFLRKPLGRLAVALGRRSRRLTIADYFFSNPHVGSLGVLFKRQLGISLGGFRPEQFPTADNWFFVRFAAEFRSYMLNRRLACYRVHENESVKPEVLGRFVEDGLRMRALLNERFFQGSTILDGYSVVFSKYQALGLRAFWTREIGHGRAVDSEGMKKHLLRIGAFLLRQASVVVMARKAHFQKK